MLETLLNILQTSGYVIAYVFVAVLCLAAVILSCVSFSGTWVVTLAAVIVMILPGTAFPGIWTIVVFLVISAAVEGVEWVASSWGVLKRGGSKWAGFAALLGGIAGLFVGGFIPVPVVGSLIGMLLCSFLLVYWVERHALKKEEGKAAHIAMGAVVARFFVIFFKVVTTLGMIAAMVIGIVMHAD